MSKILIYTDVHYTSNSSIIRSRGNKYGARLENCIESVNWAEKLAEDLKCDMVICAGDFFDHNNLTAEELTGLQDLKFNNLPHYFICGNHEITTTDCSISSMHLFNNFKNITVIDKPADLNCGNFDICFLPYISESRRKTLAEDLICSERSEYVKRIVISHNDIKGLKYGAFTSENGYTLDEIEANCDLFINGHLHNGSFLNEKQTILNLGNLTGQNFGEDASKYEHYIVVIDTDTFELTFYINPFAYNFFKLDMTEQSVFPDIKNNSVITLKCREAEAKRWREYLSSNPKIIASRVIIVANDSDDVVQTITLDKIDHLDLFKSFILEKLGNLDIVKSEISEIVGEL